MVVTLRDILSLDAVRAADPVIIHGADQLERCVRWVHTSELAEAASLLRGGELLLTTGLGLAGRGPVAQALYVDALADRAAAALGLELGWSFSQVPEALRTAAIRRDLPLIALRTLVPFVEMTEAVQTRILSDELESLRAERSGRHLLDTALSRGAGIAELVAVIAAHVMAPVAVETRDGRLVAVHGLPPRGAVRLRHHSGTTTPIGVNGDHWGWLHILAGATGNRERAEAIRHHSAGAIALVLARDHDQSALRDSLARHLLDDLVTGRLVNPGEVVARTELVEPAIAAARCVGAVALAGLAPDDLGLTLYATSSALSELGPAIAATVDTTVLGLVAAPGLDPDALAADIHRRTVEMLRLRGAAAVPTLATAIVAPGLVDVGRALSDARTTAALLATLRPEQRFGSVDSLTALRLVHRVADDHEAERLVSTHLGPILHYDDQYGTQLGPTLAAYLATGVSKTELADRLHLRRQTIYQRLAKIESLIGPINGAARRTSLLLALQVDEIRRARRTRDPRP